MAINSYICHIDFALADLNFTGHMLKVIIIEKDTFEIVDAHIDCPRSLRC